MNYPKNTRYTKRQRMVDFYARFNSLGIDGDTADALRHIEMTLSRWGEAECNGEIQRDETPEETPRRYYGQNMDKSYPVADKERGALKRLDSIMQRFPNMTAYHQTDPRGCSLYIVPKEYIKPGDDISSVYTRGFSVCY